MKSIRTFALAVALFAAISASAQVVTSTGWGEQERESMFGASLSGIIDTETCPTDDSDMRMRGYLFSKYEQATIKFLNGDVIKSPMNYFMGIEKMHFRGNDGKVQEVANFDKIEYIIIKNRVFFFDADGLAKERVSTAPELYAAYSCAVNLKENVKDIYRDQNSTANYGFHSRTTNDNTYYGSDQSSSVTISYGKIKFGSVKCTYWLNYNGKMKKFKNLDSFAKIFKKEVRPQIEEFAKTRQIDFINPSQVIEICKYATEL